MLPNAFFTINGKEYGSMYGVCIAIGILCCFIMLSVYVKKKNVDQKIADFVFYDAIIAIALGFLSATLFQSVYNYLENPSAGFEFGGMTFIGGLIGGVAVFLIIYFATKNNIRKNYKGTLSDILPIAPSCITVAHAFGRLGCLCAGCCYGKKQDGFPGLWMQVWENGRTVEGYYLPTQLYEALFLFALCAVLTYLAYSKKYKRPADNLAFYLLAYGVWRFFLEYLRADDRGKLFNILSPSQFWSVLMVLIGLFILFGLPAIESRFAAKKPVNSPSAAENEPVMATIAETLTDSTADNSDKTDTIGDSENKND